MKSHGLRLRGKQTVAARPAMAALAGVPPFVEGARMPSLAARPDARPDAKAAKAAAPTGASTPCAGGQADDVRPLSKTCWAELGALFHDCWRWRKRVIQELPNRV